MLISIFSSGFIHQNNELFSWINWLISELWAMTDASARIGSVIIADPIGCFTARMSKLFRGLGFNSDEAAKRRKIHKNCK